MARHLGMVPHPEFGVLTGSPYADGSPAAVRGLMLARTLVLLGFRPVAAPRCVNGRHTKPQAVA